MHRLERIVIDDRTQEAALPNKLCNPALISGDLAQLVQGDIVARVNTAERAAFIFRGQALDDLAVAVLAYQQYQAKT